MRSILIFLISQTILLPVIAGLVRIGRIDQRYQPFFILLCIGLLTEIISFTLIKAFHTTNAAAISIYNLVEWTLIVWQFHQWGFLKQKRRLLYGLLVIATLAWFTENIIFGEIADSSPYFLFFDYFVIVLLSIRSINYMITHDNRALFRNPQFLICIAFILYFLYMILYTWASTVSAFGKTAIFYLMAYINALANIIYAIAFLLIPAKVRFTLKNGP